MAKKTETTNKDTLLPETSSQRILLEEFQFLQNQYLHNRDQGITRMNFFITATSVAIGGVLVFGSNNSNLPLQYFKLILLFTLVLLCIIGLDLYNYLINRDISADRSERGLARIRKYFINLDPKIKGYFITRYSDAPTKYLTYRGSGIRRTSQVIESFLLGLITTILLTFTLLIPEVVISGGFIAALLAYLILEINAHRRLGAALRKVKQNISENYNE